MIAAKSKKRTRNNYKLAVALARDVLKRLKGKKIQAKKSTYGQLTFDLAKGVKDKDDLQKSLLKVKQCEVCALGACFVSYAKLYDNIKIHGSDLLLGTTTQTLRLKHGHVKKILDKVFTIEQMGLIESAYECPSIYVCIESYPFCFRFLKAGKGVRKIGMYYDFDFGSTYTPNYEFNIDSEVYEIFVKAVRFGEQYCNLDERIAAIMKNIVKNKGKFVP